LYSGIGGRYKDEGRQERERRGRGGDKEGKKG
jgi:hypothetical protein